MRGRCTRTVSFGATWRVSPSNSYSTISVASFVRSRWNWSLTNTGIL
ncbi:hypothetical protein ACLK17_01280 [Escherichia coli]